MNRRNKPAICFVALILTYFRHPDFPLFSFPANFSPPKKCDLFMLEAKGRISVLFLFRNRLKVDQKSRKQSGSFTFFRLVSSQISQKNFVILFGFYFFVSLLNFTVFIDQIRCPYSSPDLLAVHRFFFEHVIRIKYFALRIG